MSDAAPPAGESENPSHMWGGRFTAAPDELVQQYTASIQTDLVLYRHDIAGSRAHARMLAAQGIIPADTGEAIIEGLQQIEREKL